MRMLIAILLTASSYCHAYAVFHDATGNPYTWNSRLDSAGYIPWQIEGNPPAIVRESLLYAIDTWTAASGDALLFKEGTGGFTVVWDESLDYYLGYATFSTIGTSIESGQIRFNAKQYIWHRDPWDDGATINGRANLDSVMLHELGHMLGLNHVDNNMKEIVGEWSSTNLPTMFSILMPGASTLHEDDIAGLKYLYPSLLSSPQIVYRIAAHPTGRLTFLRVRSRVRFDLDPVDVALWDFGDGSQMQIGSQQFHSYKKPGEYIVKATVNGKTYENAINILKRRSRSR